MKRSTPLAYAPLCVLSCGRAGCPVERSRSRAWRVRLQPGPAGPGGVTLHSRAPRLAPLTLRTKQQAPAASRRAMPTAAVPTSRGFCQRSNCCRNRGWVLGAPGCLRTGSGSGAFALVRLATLHPGNAMPVSADEASSLVQRSSVRLDSRRRRRPGSQGCRGRRTGPHCWPTPPRLLVDSPRFHAYTRSTIDSTNG